MYVIRTVGYRTGKRNNCRYLFLLIVFLCFSVGMVYIAQNNLMPVSLHIGSYVFTDIPLFYVIIGSLLTGLGFAYLLHAVNAIITGFSLWGKDKTIRRGKGEIADLTKRILQLEQENKTLKNLSAAGNGEHAP